MLRHVADGTRGAERLQLRQQAVLLDEIGPATQHPAALARRAA